MSTWNPSLAGPYSDLFRALAIYDLYKAKYYHRDISERNLIIVDDEDIERPQQDSATSCEAPQEDAGKPHNRASGSRAAEPRNAGSKRLENTVEAQDDGSETKPRKQRTGYIIDFDCAAKEEHKRSATALLTVSHCCFRSLQYSHRFRSGDVAVHGTRDAT